MSSPLFGRNPLDDGDAMRERMPGDGEQEATLCLKFGESIFPVYEITEQTFSLSSSAGDSLETDDEGSDTPRQTEIYRGHLVTENGQLFIPVGFRYVGRDQQLSYCELTELTSDSKNELNDLIGLIYGDDAEPQETDLVRRPGGGVLLEAPDGRMILVQEDNVPSSVDTHLKKRRSKLRGPLAIAGLGAVALFGFLAIPIPEQKNEAPRKSGSMMALAEQSTRGATKGPEIASNFDSRDANAKKSIVLGNGPEQPLKKRGESARGRVVFTATQLRSNASGKVSSVLVKKSEFVERGQIVATLETSVRPAELQRLQSELTLVRAEANVTRRQVTHTQRMLELERKKLDEQLTEIQSRMKVAKAEFGTAAAEWKNIEQLVAKNNIGRNESEQIRKQVVAAKANYLRIENELQQKQASRDLAKSDLIVSDRIEAPLDDLVAELEKTEARIVYLEEMIEIETSQVDKAELLANESGYIRDIWIRPGSEVASGDVMMDLESEMVAEVEFKVSVDWANELSVSDQVTMRLVDSNEQLAGTVISKTTVGSEHASGEADALELVHLRVSIEDDKRELPAGTMVILDSSLNR